MSVVKRKVAAPPIPVCAIKNGENRVNIYILCSIYIYVSCVCRSVFEVCVTSKRLLPDAIFGRMFCYHAVYCFLIKKKRLSKLRR